MGHETKFKIGHFEEVLTLLLRGPAGEPGRFLCELGLVDRSDDRKGPARRARKLGCDVVRLEFIKIDVSEGKAGLLPANFHGVFVLGNAYARRYFTPWTGEQFGQVVLVPTDPRFDEHYAIGAAGRFQWRPGRPAADLKHGAGLAMERLWSLHAEAASQVVETTNQT